MIGNETTGELDISPVSHRLRTQGEDMDGGGVDVELENRGRDAHQRSFLNGSSDVDSEWEGRRQAKQEQAVPCVSVEPVQTAEE